MNSQTSTKQTKAEPNKKTAESAESFSAMKRNQNVYNEVQANWSRVTSAEELGSMSKNNLQLPLGFTLLR